MYVRAKENKNKLKYLQVVESYRADKGPRQRVLWTLGRLDILHKSGKLDSLIRSAIRFSEKLALIEASDKASENLGANKVKIGPTLIFERLWKNLKIDETIKTFAEKRHFGFSLERAIF